MNRKPKTNQKNEEEESAVDSLLRAAEDELLLNLSLSSHTSRGTSHSPNSYINPDLDRRFQSLKLKSSRRPPPPPTPTENLPPAPPTSTENPPPPASDDQGDLLARFAALKGDSSYSSSTTTSCFQDSNFLQPDRGKMASSDDAVGEDEVQKLIKWAIDAARLDPSPPTDDDDDDDDDSSNDDDDSDDGFGDRGGSGSKDNRKKRGRNKGVKVARLLAGHLRATNHLI